MKRRSTSSLRLLLELRHYVGGHPHIVQLLGSHIIQHENADPDGVLNIDDLLGVFQRVCYQDRSATYAAALHMLENAGKLNSLTTLLTGASRRRIPAPTRVRRRRPSRQTNA